MYKLPAIGQPAAAIELEPPAVRAVTPALSVLDAGASAVIPPIVIIVPVIPVVVIPVPPVIRVKFIAGRVRHIGVKTRICPNHVVRGDLGIALGARRSAVIHDPGWPGTIIISSGAPSITIAARGTRAVIIVHSRAAPVVPAASRAVGHC